MSAETSTVLDVLEAAPKANAKAYLRAAGIVERSAEGEIDTHVAERLGAAVGDCTNRITAAIGTPQFWVEALKAQAALAISCAGVFHDRKDVERVKAAMLLD